MEENRKIRVAITHGDTNGIGYELIFKTFAAPEMLELCTPIIYGSPKVAAYHRKALDIPANFSIITHAADAKASSITRITMRISSWVTIWVALPSMAAQKLR